MLEPQTYGGAVCLKFRGKRVDGTSVSPFHGLSAGNGSLLHCVCLWCGLCTYASFGVAFRHGAFGMLLLVWPLGMLLLVWPFSMLHLVCAASGPSVCTNFSSTPSSTPVSCIFFSGESTVIHSLFQHIVLCTSISMSSFQVLGWALSFIFRSFQICTLQLWTFSLNM